MPMQDYIFSTQLDQPIDIGVTTIAAHMALSYHPLSIFKALSKNPKNFNT